MAIPDSPSSVSLPPDDAVPRRDPDIAAAVHALGPDAWWAADIVPVLAPQEEDPTARFAVAVIMAHDVVVYSVFVRHPGADHAAELVVRALRAAAHTAGVWPEQLVVRGEGFDFAVEEVIERTDGIPDIAVYGVPRFSDFAEATGKSVDAALLDLRHRLDGAMIPDVPASASPTWAAWGLRPERIEGFFRATAALYDAISLRRMTDGGAIFLIESPELDDALTVLFGTDDALATVLVFDERDDWEAMVAAGTSDPMSADVRFPMSCISYVPREALPTFMADEVDREIAAGRWEIAGPAAYPTLWLLNAAGGGMTTEYCATLVDRLDALTRAVTHAAPQPLHPESIFQYVDAPTGLTVRTILEEGE